MKGNMRTASNGKTWEQMIAGIPKNDGRNWPTKIGNSLVIVRPVGESAYTVECVWTVPEAYSDDVDTFGHYPQLGQRPTIGIKVQCQDLARAVEVADDCATHCEQRTNVRLFARYSGAEHRGNVHRHGMNDTIKMD